jgi:hypothetical protein
MDGIFVEEKATCINFEPRFLGLAMALVFQESVQFRGQQFFFAFHKCAHDIVNLMDLALVIKD